MLIINIFFFIILAILLVDFKKGVLMYAPMKLFFNINVRFGTFTFDFLVSLIIFLLFFKDWKKYKKTDFPLKKAFLIYGIVYIITCIIPNFVPNYIPRIILMVLLFSYVYYYCLDSLNNIKFAIVCYAIFAIVMCGNGLLTPAFGINPLDDFLQSVSDEDNSLFMDNELVRMGQVRYRSFIPHAISYGVACCAILYLLIWSFLQMRKFSTILIYSSLCFLLSGIIICGSRTPIIGLLPIGYLFFAKGHVTTRMKIMMGIVIMAFLLFKGDYILYSIKSLIDPRVAYESGGSTTELRMIQYAIALKFFLTSPIWGMGMDFDAFAEDSDIMGSESVWLPLMINNGIIGVLSYAIFYWYLLKVSVNSPGKVFLIIISTGWILMRTVTSLIGVTDALFLTIYFCIYRYYDLKYKSMLLKMGELQIKNG